MIARASACGLGWQTNEGSTSPSIPLTSPTSVDTTGRLHDIASFMTLDEPSLEDVTRRQSAAFIIFGISAGDTFEETWRRSPGIAFRASCHASSACQMRLSRAPAYAAN